MVIGALSAVLVWRIAGRVSPRAGLVAGLFYAVWQPAAYAERTTLLEPLVNLGLLGGAGPARPGRQPAPGRRRRRRARPGGRGEGVGGAAVPRARALAAAAGRLARHSLVRRCRRGGRRCRVPAVPGRRRPARCCGWWCSTSSAGRTTASTAVDRLASIEALQLSPAPISPRLALIAVLAVAGGRGGRRGAGLAPAGDQGLGRPARGGRAAAARQPVLLRRTTAPSRRRPLALLVGAGADTGAVLARGPAPRWSARWCPPWGWWPWPCSGARRHPAGGPAAAAGERDGRRAGRRPLRRGRQRRRPGRRRRAHPRPARRLPGGAST